MIDKFFDTSRYTVSLISDQYEIKPATSFTVYTIIIDSIKYTQPASLSAKLIKTIGRDQTELPTVVTITGQAFTATPALIDWDGKTSLSLKVLIDGIYTVLVPLVQKG